jgi:ribosomal protein S27AE
MTFKQIDTTSDENLIKFELKDVEQYDSYEIRIGVVCPKCQKGTFEYDGMLNLVCSNCGYTSGGCFT